MCVLVLCPEILYPLFFIMDCVRYGVQALHNILLLNIVFKAHVCAVCDCHVAPLCIC